MTRALAALSLLFVGTALAAQPPKSPSDSAGAVLFETKVRPVFAARCLACHTGKEAQGGLRLDQPGGWASVVDPKKPDESKLLRAVRHAPGVSAMPPTGSKLTEREIAGLAEWIARGAPGPAAKINRPDPAKHWAFQLLKPAPKDTTIDALIQTKLRLAGLTQNPSADRRTLLRRLSFDLIGLPPTPAEVDAFLADTTPNAYEKQVDRLLVSPHFGEKWGRHWLDLARFAESHGYEQDYDRPNAYTYRDFVIKAINDDLPYDKFVQWQLAGDELAPDNPQALFATGFLGAGTHATQITKSQVEKERYDELDDMLSVTSQAFLGLTVGCARCHDHKYDAIPTKDYYRMLATFTKTVRSDYEVPLDPRGDQARLAAWESAHQPLVAARSQWEQQKLASRFATWSATKERRAPEWIIPKVEKMLSQGGATLTAQPDGSVLVTGTNPEHEQLVFTLKTTQKTLAALRVEALTHPSLVLNGPGRASNGNFALSQLTVQVDGKPVALATARADFEQKGLPVAAVIDSDRVSAWAVDPQFGKSHSAVFVFQSPVALPENATVTVTLAFNNNTGHGMGRPRLSFAERADAPLDGLAVSDGPDGLRQWYKTIDPEWKALSEAVEKHDALRPKPTLQKGMICSEGVTAIRTHTQGGDYLENTHFLKRGDPNNKGEVVTQSFLTVLRHAAESRWQTPPPPGWRTTYQRRAFAAWLTDTDKGAGQLAARVIVNRLWLRYFGRGIVNTPSDFGTQGDRPTDPVLLDTLAARLIASGWKLKALHKEIVMSAAYRASSADNVRARKLDPENKLVWRNPRTRLEAENLRDAMLFVSGQLDEKLYGPGTLDEGMTRRGIYFFIKRSKLVPFLVAFDGPNALQSIGVRQTTTVAPQALTLLNNPRLRSWAEALARRAQATTPEASVTAAYRLALCRRPTASERTDATQFLQSGGTLADLCQVLFSLNEFAYVD